MTFLTAPSALIAAALLAPLAGATAPSAAAHSIAPTACVARDELPLVYRGDGMTAKVTAIDERTGELIGTLTLDRGAPMPFTVAIDEDGRGRGQVTAPDRVRPLRTRDVDDRTVRVTYRARRYTLVLVDAPAPERRAAPDDRPRATPKGAVTLALQTLTDPGMRGMDSHTVLVPKGWTVEGGAFWAPQVYFSVLPSQDIRVTSPGGVSVRIEPKLTAKAFQPPPELGVAPPPTGSSDKGFPVVPLPQDVAGWKRWMEGEILPSDHPKARRIRVRDAAVVPELTWEMKRRHAPYKRMLEQNNGRGMGSHTTADCAVLGFESTYELDGVTYEELRIVAFTYMHNDGPYTGRATMWSVESAVTYRAPEGELEEHVALLKTIADSVRMTPKWANMRARHHAKLLKISHESAMKDLEAARKRSEIIAQSGRDLSDIIHDGYRQRDAVRSSSHDKVIHAIRGTEEYRAPGSDTVVHLPFGYDHVYSNGRDEYLLTNDALFEPDVNSATNGVEWTRMSVAR